MLKIVLLIYIQLLVNVTPFGITSFQPTRWKTQLRVVDNERQDENNDSDNANDNDNDNGGGSSYQSSSSLTKGMVSSLTSLTNAVLQKPASSESRATPPTSPQELISRIRDDYTQNNYLWTGNLDTSSFVSNCTFTDPTLSFVGVDTFIRNVGSLVPVVEFLLGDEQLSRSDLLEITLNDEKQYIETRWNMVGELNRLFWRPRIDVIGRTKFWYREVQDEEDGGENNSQPAVKVYFYDEEWEVPAGLALLQLVTTAGTIANTQEKSQ
ncbi:hypothetical protein ACHAXR_001176 [Thalassiosira sp. AJA248-18]